MQTFLLTLHVFLAAGMIGLILIQHGKGADAGAAFGGGGGGAASVFGSGGSSSFLGRATAVLALLFFTTSLSLAYLSAQVPKEKGMIEQALEMKNNKGDDKESVQKAEGVKEGATPLPSEIPE